VAVQNLTADAAVFTCNAYLVSGAENTLVDAGAMPGIVEELKTATSSLDRVVLTHQHSDHVGQLDAVVDAFDPEVHAFGEHGLRTHELRPGETVQIGDDFFDVVATPGHADDHVSLLSDQRLFSGDVVVYEDEAFTGGSFGRTDGAGRSREQLIDSIRRLLDRLPDSVEWMYSGHGDVYQGDVQAIVERALERAQRREAKYPNE
jgi:hydroxyacylglutathione hydrolase